ncbi:CDP-diacylglycerol pyrophosphatase [Cupriavidus sp. 2TAF22]|uniref:CDP-diacylglycerol pyrophosphatase n=1 Tax=unclassified Cupriavidus TaxID=2640874 RepID=UPI003F8E55AE
MRVTIRTITIPGGKGRAALHKAVVYMTTEQEAAPLMTSEWSQREPEAFMAAQTWARRNTYIVSNPRTGTFYGSPAGR